jgi:hypothetical protein
MKPLFFKSKKIGDVKNYVKKICNFFFDIAKFENTDSALKQGDLSSSRFHIK